MMDDLFLLTVYTGAILAILTVCAALADYVGPWLDKRRRRW